jgi:hypothetical protein
MLTTSVALKFYFIKMIFFSVVDYFENFKKDSVEHKIFKLRKCDYS